jgi:plasmid stability protein
MASLTLSIDEQLLKRARIRALERDTSVNALVRDYLQRLVTEESRSHGMAPFLELTESLHAGSGSQGRRWTREELHER